MLKVSVSESAKKCDVLKLYGIEGFNVDPNEVVDDDFMEFVESILSMNEEV